MTGANNNKTDIASPFSTGGGGNQFEAHIQSSFVVLMLANGFVPCLPPLPIRKIKLQGKIDGYQTDDLIIYMENRDGSLKQKLLGQVKHSVSFTAKDPVFYDVIRSAWIDFNNDALFSKRHDAIALITGPLSSVDIDGTRWILEWARHCESADEFLRDVDTAKFSSRNKQTKLAAFKAQLTKANQGSEVSKQQLFEFLRHFHVLSYDLDVKSGVILSLLRSLMNQFSIENVRSIWAQVIDEVQTANKNAGTITRENMPHDIRSAFERPVYVTMPQVYASPEHDRLDLNQLPHASAIAVSNLFGGWDENYDSDIAAISDLVGETYPKWILKLQDELQIASTPISLRDGKWHVNQRFHVWQTLGQRIFDRTLDAFKASAIKTLSERDPKFELLPAARFSAAINGKVLTHSRTLRKGIAETLALMGSFPEALHNCSAGKGEIVATLIIREIFKNADWVMWGTLNELLPLIAEAAPEEFLNIVDRDLGESPCPFDELFRQEGDGINGENYITGLLWALESLAWEEKYLVQVCVALGELAARDPGGPSGNRPFNSLQTILLPWLPQTGGSIQKRTVAIQTIVREQAGIAWKLLMSLMPRSGQSSLRSHRPSFRETPSALINPEVTRGEYWDQITQLFSLALDLAGDDLTKLADVAAVLDRLPIECVGKFVKKLASMDLLSQPEGARIQLWKTLRKLITKPLQQGARIPDGMPDALLALESIVKTIEPENPAHHFQKLFGHNDPEYYRDKSASSWEEKDKQQAARRQLAIKQIFDYGGPSGILDFIEIADEPVIVGHTLGLIDDYELDHYYLPQKLNSNDERMQHFLSGYIRSRFHKHGWDWVSRLSVSAWSSKDIGRFLARLPFSSGTWKYVTRLLGESDQEYWIHVNPNPYEANAELDYAVDKLLDNNRPILALACLHRTLHEKQALNLRLAERAFECLCQSEEINEVADRHDVLEVLKALQNAPQANPDIVGKIEWQFLQLLDRDLDGAPRMLEQRLASSPQFFCEVIRTLYHSKNVPKESRSDPSPREQALAKNAWTLLRHWRRVPGTNIDGIFSPESFNEWLQNTRKISTGSGHLNAALSHVGCVLFYSPPDPDGLWIHHTVAQALNEREAEKLREGFRNQIFNSRGVYWVDPSGRQELELSQQYRTKADDVENAGYQRLAAALRATADSYAREAAQVIKEAKEEEEQFESIHDQE